MNLPLWTIDLAETFWREAGKPEPFPRALRQPLLGAPSEVTVTELQGLSVRRVEAYLGRLDLDWTSGERDGPLRGCLVAIQGAGFIFLDGADPAAERAFSLALGLAHFLRHSRQPRQRAVAALGEQVLEVFEAHRSAQPAERLHALLRRMAVGAHVHLMRRQRRAGRVSEAEEEANLLARELLAPRDAVLACWPAGTDRHDRLRLESLLQADFGLSERVAREYAATLWLEQFRRPDPRASVSLAERLQDALNRGREACSGEPCDEPRP